MERQEEHSGGAQTLQAETDIVKQSDVSVQKKTEPDLGEKKRARENFWAQIFRCDALSSYQ